MPRRAEFAPSAPMGTRSRMQSLRPQAGPSYGGIGVAPRAPSNPVRAPSLAESSMSTIATMERLGDNSARKRRRIFSGERRPVAPSLASASGLPRSSSGLRDASNRQPQRLRPSLEFGANGELNAQAVIDRCSILAIQSKSVLDFYGRFQYDGWSDETIPRMNATWEPFNSYKVHQLLVNKDYAHHFVNVAEVIGQLEVEPEQVPAEFEDTMRLVNFATFIHYVFQIPTNVDAFGELEDGRVTQDIALTAPIRALTELNDARRVFFKWILPNSWSISDEILCMFLDLSTHIHIQRVRLYVDSVDMGQMTAEELEVRVSDSINELTSEEVLLNSLSQTAKERKLSAQVLDRLVIRYQRFAQVRSEDLVEFLHDWLSMLKTWPLQRLTDDLLQLVEKAVKNPSVPLQSFSLEVMRDTLALSFFVDQERKSSGPLPDQSKFNDAGPSNGEGTVIIREAPAESTPRPRNKLLYPRSYDPDNAPATQEFSEDIRAVLQDEDADSMLDLEGDALLDDETARHIAITKAMMDSQDVVAEGDTVAEPALSRQKPPQGRIRKSAGTIFPSLDLAGDSDGKSPTTFLQKKGKGKARELLSSEDENDNDDISLHEEDEEDPHERSQAMAASKAGRGRASIGAEAARGEAGNRAMSSHTRDAIGRRQITIGKDNKLTRATAAKKSIFDGESKGERITFEEEDDPFLTEQISREREGKETKTVALASKRTTRSAAASRFTPDADAESMQNGDGNDNIDSMPNGDGNDNIDSMPNGDGNGNVDSMPNGDENGNADSMPTDGGKGKDKGKQRAVEDSPRRSPQEEEPFVPAVMDGANDMDFGPGYWDDDDGPDIDAIIRGLNEDEADDARAGMPMTNTQDTPKDKPEDATDKPGNTSDKSDDLPGDRSEENPDIGQEKTSVVEDSEEAEGSDASVLKSVLSKSTGSAGKRKFPPARPKAMKDKPRPQASVRSARQSKPTKGGRSSVLAKAGRKRPREGDELVSDDETDAEASEAEGDAKRSDDGATTKGSDDDKEDDIDGEDKEEDELESDSDYANVKKAQKKKKRRKSAVKDEEGSSYGDKKYSYGVNGRRFWTPEETKCLMDALNKYAHLATIERPASEPFYIWQYILERHGPRGTKSRVLARRNNMQLKDKARVELERMRRNDQAMPYWKRLMFPSLFKKMKNPGKVKKMPANIELSDEENGAQGEDIVAEEEEEGEEDEDEIDGESPPPAQPSPPKKKNMAKGGPLSKRKNKGLPDVNGKDKEENPSAPRRTTRGAASKASAREEASDSERDDDSPDGVGSKVGSSVARGKAAREEAAEQSKATRSTRSHKRGVNEALDGDNPDADDQDSEKADSPHEEDGDSDTQGKRPIRTRSRAKK
ncbi:hypothetical protein A4X13_0g2405 [Tilletia indica]|uniref:Uncharacterized protein n=1 Tax=Tilletia indica TaxID=43049 RepID=A0A8T8T8G6_9BASI|nr:hypothetical protein A4X13_0g2405 [Tilletia indica]